MAPEDMTIHGKISPDRSQKVATIEQPCRRGMSFISSLRAARRRHASVRMDIDAQLIIVVSVPFIRRRGRDIGGTGKLFCNSGLFRNNFLFPNSSVVAD
jgi:hypothetical protein